MDWRESQPKQKCGVCHVEGHNSRRCPNVISTSTSSDVPNQVSMHSIIVGKVFGMYIQLLTYLGPLFGVHELP